MKNQKLLIALMTSAALLSGCGGSMLGSSDAEDYKMIPDVVTEDPNPQRPSANLNVLKTSDTNILFNGNSVLLRGVNLQYGNNPTQMYPGIKAIREVGSNVVRILVKPDTSTINLEAALTDAITNDLFVVLALDDEKLFCNDDDVLFSDAIKKVWLKNFLPVIHQDRFQGNLMINIARGWGPKDVFNGYSTGYRTYLDNYKTAIRTFRKAGFEVPLVIDAPCGEDFYAFESNRGRELYLTDEKRNIVLSVNAYGRYWNNTAKLDTALASLAATKMPFILTEFGGSKVGDKPVNHKYIMQKAAGDVAFSINVPWQDPQDKVSLIIPLDETVDVTGAEISFDIQFDKSYIEDGKMGFQMYLRDENNEYANIGWNEVWKQTPGVFNTIKMTVNNDASFGWASPNFDKTRVAKVGIELISNGKPVDIVGAISLDNFKIAEGSGAKELFNVNFEQTIEGWVSGWNGTTVSLEQGEGVALLKGNDTDELSAIFSGITGVDFTQPVQIKANIFFPKGFEGSWTYGKFFNNTVNNDDGTCCQWQPTSDIGSITYGEWNEMIVTADFGAKGATVTSLGIQLGFLGVTGDNPRTVLDFNEAIIIKDLIISGIEKNTASEVGVIYHSTFDVDADNWVSYSWGDSGTVTVADGSLNIVAADFADRIDIQHNNPAKIEGINFNDPFTLKTRIFIPQYYESIPGFQMQFYLQDGNWSNHFNVFEYTHDQIIYGDWNEISIAVVFPEGFERNAVPRHLGFSFATNLEPTVTGVPMSKTEPIRIDEVIFEGLVPVEKEEVVIALIDFYYPRHFTDLDIESTEGAITPDLLANTGSSLVRNEPFSWLAWSWYGNAGDEAGFDMTTNVGDAEALTERGQDIVFGKGGLQDFVVPQVEPAAQ